MYVDVDDCEDMANFFEIKSLPTLKSIYWSAATKGFL